MKHRWTRQGQALSLRATWLSATLALILGACGSARSVVKEASVQPVRHETLNAVVWMQHSAEYAASARQAYRMAGVRLHEGVSDTSWNALSDRESATGAHVGRMPVAVILDVDETVLDNSPYQARLVREDAVYSRDSWKTWVAEEAARAVPGALEFTRAAASSGVRVFYVTNRSADLESATRNNLLALGFPLSEAEDVLLTRGERSEWTGDKSTRRAHVGARYRVVLLIGDDLNDFVSADDASQAERSTIVSQFADRWGKSWIMLPNPAYGSWERAVNRGAGARSRDEQVQAKTNALEIR